MVPLLLLFLFNTLVTGQNCVFQDPNTGAVLDLTALLGQRLEVNDPIDGYNYSYSPCENILPCVDHGDFMAVQTLNNECYYLAEYNNSVIQPFYQPNNGLWIFNYDNGEYCTLYPIDRYFTAYFHCNPDVEVKVINASQDYICGYEMHIETEYACATIEDKCEWETSDGQHTLNLTSIQGKVLSKIDSLNGAQTISLTPCANKLSCNNNQAMGSLVNTETVTCEQTTARWDFGALQPMYDTEDQIWQFEYRSGDKCNDLNPTFEVYYRCDETVNVEVIQASNPAPCLYEMQVNTRLACN